MGAEAQHILMLQHDHVNTAGPFDKISISLPKSGVNFLLLFAELF